MRKSNSRSWIWQPHYWVVLAFMLGSGIFHGPNQLRMIGVVLTLFAVYRSFNYKTSLFAIGFPAELKFYLLWGVWAILTGIIVADVPFIFWYNVKILVQMMIMLFSVGSLMFFQRDDRPFLVSVVLVAIINIVAVAMGYVSEGEGHEVYLDTSFDVTESRATGIARNSNSLGFILLEGIWAVMMLYGLIAKRRRVGKMIVLLCSLGAIFVFGRYVIYTGSRKSLLTMAAMVAAWVFWILPNGKGVEGLLTRMIVGFGVFMIGSSIMAYVLTDTLVGSRFQQLMDAGGGNAAVGFKESNIRYLMYIDGLKIWLRHPIAGVGLGQFIVHFFSGHYSHSDYIEPLACTGLIGFVLYQGFAGAVLFRLIKMLRYRLSDSDMRTVKGMLLFIVLNHFFIGFGSPHWAAKSHELIVMFCGVWSYRVSLEYRALRGRIQRGFYIV